MALHETRFGWNLDTSTDFGENLFQAFTQKVHLEPGKKHVIQAVDMYIDSLNIFKPGIPEEQTSLVGTVILSPYPAWESASVGEFGALGPFASEPLVLYKANFEFTYDPEDPIGPNGAAQLTKLREFPQQTIAAGESFAFYSNQLYMTVLLTKFEQTAHIE